MTLDKAAVFEVLEIRKLLKSEQILHKREPVIQL